MPEEIEALWQQASTGCGPREQRPVAISLPATKYALPTYYIIAPAEASSNLARYDGVRFGLRVDGDSLDEMYETDPRGGLWRRGPPPGADRDLCAVGRLLRRLLLEGAAGAHLDCARLRDGVRAGRLHPDPTTPSAAFAIGEKTDDPIAMYLNDVFTVPANLAGVPAISSRPGFRATGCRSACRSPAAPSTRKPCCALPRSWKAPRNFDICRALWREATMIEGRTGPWETVIGSRSTPR